MPASLLKPLYNGVLFLIHYFKKHFKPCFFILRAFKTFCSTSNSWIGEFVVSFFDVTNRLNALFLSLNCSSLTFNLYYPFLDGALGQKHFCRSLAQVSFHWETNKNRWARSFWPTSNAFGSPISAWRTWRRCGGRGHWKLFTTLKYVLITFFEDILII